MKKALGFFRWYIAISVGIAFLVVAAPLALAVSIFAWWHFNKKSNEKYTNVAKLSTVVSALGTVFFIYAINTPTVQEALTDPAEESSVIAQDESKLEASEIIEEEPESTKEEKTEELEEEDSDSIDENIMFLDSGVALYTDTRGVTFGEKSHLEIFSGTHVSTLKDNHKDFKNGVIFRNVMPLQDQYGNQEDTNVIAVYYSPETIEKINFDNWPALDSSGLYQTADNVFIHYILLNEASEFRGYGHTEGAPVDFYDYVGGTTD